MDCPICNGRFPVGQIQSHVEQCLIDQDAAVALKVHQEMNDASVASRAGPNRPEKHVPAAQMVSFSEPPPPSPSSPSLASNSVPPPRFGPSSVPSSHVQPTQYKSGPNYAPPSAGAPKQVQPASGPDSRVYGAMQADVDQYNQKIGAAHKQLHQIRDSLQSFSERISLLEMRQHERIIPPVEIASLPPPRYMAMKTPQSQQLPQQTQQKRPMQPQGRSPSGMPLVQAGMTPTPQDKRQRFFQTAQRFYNDKSGANSFFLGATNAAHPSPPQFHSPPPALASHPSVSPIPASNPTRDPISSPAAPIPPSKPQPSPPSSRSPETGITDIHVAQIESKWISMILQYPDDAEDLILGHLTMLFSQRVKDEKSAEISEISLSNSQTSDSSLSDSGLGASGVKDSKDSSQHSFGGNGMQHPLSEYVGQMIETWNEPFSRMREPSQETLQTAVNMVNGLIATLEDVVLDYYKELSARHVPRFASPKIRAAAEHREYLVRQGVRGAIWPLFYNDVMKLIRLKTSAEDDVVNQKMKEFMTMNPAHLGIPRDYWLLEMSPDGDATNTAGRTWSTPPYYSAIQTFKELPTLHNPEAKLKCVVKSARDLVDSVATFHAFFGRNPDKYPVGGDELLPIFTYVVIRSGVKNLNSECAFMELFINDDQARGEMGYILATLQTVIAFLSVMDNDSISNSVESVFKAVAKEAEKKRKEAELVVVHQQQPHQQPSHHQDPQQPHQQLQQQQQQQPEQLLVLPHESIELQPMEWQQGSFFENDPSLDTFDGTKSKIEFREDEKEESSEGAGGTGGQQQQATTEVDDEEDFDPRLS